MTTKRQRGQSLKTDNLQEVLDASPDAKRLGTQQFETPPDIAAALWSGVNPFRPIIADLNCGHGNLLLAGKNASTHQLLGIDIDPSAQSSEYRTIIGDVNQIYPLLRQAAARFDLLALNPPFSLRWPDHFSDEPGAMVDSTLATWKMAMELLTERGEGMMICNAATAERLIGDDMHIWLKLDLPNFFPGTNQKDMRIAVLYFTRRDRRTSRLEVVTLDSAAPDAIRVALEPFDRGRYLRHSRGIDNEWDACQDESRRFEAARGEWERLKKEKLGKIEWNISLRADGTIERYLTPFEKFSGRVPMELVRELEGLAGKNPMELVVQRPTRLALQRAAESNIWRVQPELIAAVKRAIIEYNGVRAPFVALNKIQRLGYLDENDTIRCTAAFAGFQPGGVYPLSTQTFTGKKKEWRQRVGKPKEQVEVTGQELLIKIADSLGRAHGFTQFPLENTRDVGLAFSHGLQELVDHFEIPDVQDVSQVDPERFEEYKRRLLALETA